MNKLYLLAITFVIAGLMITSATSLPVTSDSKDIQPEQLPECMWSTCQLKNAQSIGTSGDVAPLFAGNQITAGEYDEYRPSIALDPSGRFFVGFDFTEDGSTYYPVFTYSEDGGSTWADGAYFSESANSKKPDCDYKTTGFFATMDPPFDNTGQVVIVDATVLEEPTGMIWDLVPNADTIQDIHIATYTHEGPSGDPGLWNWGVVAMTGNNYYAEPDIIECPLILYSVSETQGTYSWYTNSAGCKHASVDIDLVTNMSYAVYDRAVTGKYQLFLRKDNFGTWTGSGGHPSVTSKSIIGAGNLTYPDIIAEANNVLLVAQTDEAGNQDIVCYHSSNGMSSYTSTIVANDAEDEKSPQLTWIKPGVAVCTYLRGTEAYFKATEDNGASWSTEVRVSDEEIDPVEDHALTVAGINGNAYAIWQDGRGDNVDIYWDQFYTVAAPNVQIGTIAGGVGKVTMEVKNIGTGEATNVDWSISVKGGMLGRINVSTSGVIPSIAAGGATTVQTDKFIFGFGAITIQLTASGATGSKTGKVLFILVRNIL